MKKLNNEGLKKRIKNSRKSKNLALLENLPDHKNFNFLYHFNKY
jgi:hypothetical protein